MKIIGIEHIGIAALDLDTTAPFWKTILGISNTNTETIEDQKVTTDIYDTGAGKIELLHALSDDSPVARFLNKKGPGIHHVCFEVDDVTKAIKELKDNNIQVIGDNYSLGAEGYKVIFIHPKSTGGVLVELAEKPVK